MNEKDSQHAALDARDAARYRALRHARLMEGKLICDRVEALVSPFLFWTSGHRVYCHDIGPEEMDKFADEWARDDRSRKSKP
jgi:hypothetical protein